MQKIVARMPQSDHRRLLSAERSVDVQLCIYPDMRMREEEAGFTKQVNIYHMPAGSAGNDRLAVETSSLRWSHANEHNNTSAQDASRAVVARHHVCIYLTLPLHRSSSKKAASEVCTRPIRARL
jgi:hypothetical protein